MKRLWVVSMFSLALAGCAQSRSAISKQDGKPPDPVALTPVPSVYDTINRGVGGPAVARSAIKNPNDPMWAGRDQVTTVARPVSSGPTNPGTDPSQSPPSAVAYGPTGPIAGPAAQPSGPALASTPVPAAADVPAASTLPVSELPIETTPARVPVPSGPIALEPAAGPTGSPATAMPAPAPITGAAPLPIQAPRTASPGLTANGASSPTVNKPPMTRVPQSASTADPAVSPSASRQPLTTAPPTSTKAPIRRGDPLLGPSPDVMPEMPALPGEKPSAAISPAPAGPPIELAPASSPPAQTGPGAAAGPEPVGPLSAMDQSAVANKPAPAGKLAAAAPLELAPAASGASPAPEPAALRIDNRRDTQVTRTSLQSAPTTSNPLPKYLGKETGRSVARVGDEVITFHDLILAIREQLRRQPGFQQQIFNSPNPIEKNKQLDMLARYTLEGLIERSLLVQEAKHAIKDSKQLDKMMDMADKAFREEQLPQLQRQFSAETEQQLKEKFAANGRSLDRMRKEYQQDFLAQGFLHERLKDKMNIELPDQLKYYNDHMNDAEFHLPAQITWRELVVEVDKYPSRQEAQKKASALLEKLRRGEDFAKLARADSDGPASARQEGGRMQTSPGSYAVNAVNQALDSLPIGKVSGVLEGPTSFHIIRVEDRRPAGPASFEEVHQKIRPLLFDERVKTERAAFIAKLRQRSLISITLDELPGKAQAAFPVKTAQ